MLPEQSAKAELTAVATALCDWALAPATAREEHCKMRGEKVKESQKNCSIGWPRAGDKINCMQIEHFRGVRCLDYVNYSVEMNVNNLD